MRNKKLGFTLSELLMSAAILAFVLTGILALFANGVILNETNRNLTVAVAHAQFILEDIRSHTFSTLEAAINAGQWDLTRAQIQASPHNLSPLASEQIDSAVTQTGNPLGVSVTVSWRDRRQRQRTIALQTLLTDH